MSKKTKFFISLLIIICNLFSYTYALTEDSYEYEYIYGKTNLLLIGDDKKGDTPFNFFIVLGIDGNNKQLSLTSLRRDTKLKNRNDTLYDVYCNEDKQYLQKIIRENYNIKIDNYVVLNKIAIKNIVDTTNTIKINGRMAYGVQVLSYLNSTSNADISTQEKVQREVIQEMMYGFSILPFTKYPHVINRCYPYVKIDMNQFKMLCLGFTALSFNNYDALEYVLY